MRGLPHALPALRLFWQLGFGSASGVLHPGRRPDRDAQRSAEGTDVPRALARCHRGQPTLASCPGSARPRPTHPFSSALSFSTSMVSSSSLSEELYSGWARFMLAAWGLRGRVGAAGREELTAAAPLRARGLAFRTH